MDPKAEWKRLRGELQKTQDLLDVVQAQLDVAVACSDVDALLALASEQKGLLRVQRVHLTQMGKLTVEILGARAKPKARPVQRKPTARPVTRKPKT